MSDLSQDVPATEQTVDAGLPATGGGKDEIAGQLKDALGGAADQTVQDKSPHEQMRRQIGEALEKAAEPDKPVEQTVKTERARGPDGRFIPTAQEAAAGIDPNTTQADAPVAEVPAGPPGSWKKELQARWNELPPEFQAEIQKREADVAKGFEKYQNLRVHEPVLDFAENAAKQIGTTGPQLVHTWASAHEGLANPATRAQTAAMIAQAYGIDVPVSTPVTNFLAQIAPRLGTTPVEVINRWALAQDALLSPDPEKRKQAILGAAKQYGVDLGQQPGAPGEQPQWVDPDVAALKQQVAQLTGHLNAQQHQTQQYYEQQAQQVQRTKMSAIDQFASEKDASGQPLRPHLETVMPSMAAGIAQLKSANPQISDQDALQQAYDNAVWGNPQTRELAQQASRAAEERDRNEKARQRAQAATRGAVSPAGSSPQGPPASVIPKGDIRDQMRATLQQLT